jgi:hypothetical protein
MSVTFVKVGTTVTVRNPERANRKRATRMQVSGRAASGDLYVYDKGVTLYRLALDFIEVSTTVKNSLEAFFITTVQAQMQTFTYTDHNAVAWTARFVTPELEFTEHANGYWSFGFELEVVAQ